MRKEDLKKIELGFERINSRIDSHSFEIGQLKVEIKRLILRLEEKPKKKWWK